MVQPTLSGENLWPDTSETNQLSLKSSLEDWLYVHSSCSNYTISAAKKGADQTWQIHNLICASFVYIWHKQVLARMLRCYENFLPKLNIFETELVQTLTFGPRYFKLWFFKV